ncbi:MAG: NPCBM/NEW2 domain-containing protein, partial [Planctomycetales bacterium]|nr:NPCBM/NEW2 domain-containing protein [Planctomycetales bacterium]
SPRLRRGMASDQIDHKVQSPGGAGGYGVASTLLTLMLLSASPTQICAQDRELVLSDGQRMSASLASFDTQAAAFTVDYLEFPCPWDNLVRWGVLAPREARPTAVLRDGSVVVASAAWTRSGSIALSADQWSIASDAFRSIQLPRGSVRAVWFAAAGEQPQWSKVRSDSAGFSGQEDRVWLTSGDVLNGRLLKIDARSLELQVAGESVAIEQKQAAAVALSGSSQPATSAMAVGLTDGSLLYASDASLSKQSLRITLTQDNVALAGAAEALALLQPFGERVTYLSDLTPIDFRHTPYLTVTWPLARDRALSGGVLQSGGKRFLKGLAMHSASRAVYRLEGDYRRFESEVAIDQDAGDAKPGGSVVFRVYLARESGFEQAWESPIVRSGDRPLRVSLDVTGARAIALLADYADYGDQQDHADWLEARLVR